MDDDAAKMPTPFWEEPSEEFGPRLEAVVAGKVFALRFCQEWSIGGADEAGRIFAIAPYSDALYGPHIGVPCATPNYFLLIELLVVFGAHSGGHVDDLAGLPALSQRPAVACADGVDFGGVVVEIPWAGVGEYFFYEVGGAAIGPVGFES